MHTVAFVGSYGKTTSAWLTRGLLEQAEELVGMVGEIENALADTRLTLEGDIWTPDEEDPTLNRECSVLFHISPYKGKYDLPPATPDALQLQKVLAGARDRGADSALVEVCPTAAVDGRVDALRPEILVFTNVAPEKARTDLAGEDGYAERISSMFEQLDENQTGIVNLDGKRRGIHAFNPRRILKK